MFYSLLAVLLVAFVLVRGGIVRARLRHASGMPLTSVLVLVLGDVGRSPRMSLHCRSLLTASRTVRVRLVGYHENPLAPDIAEHPRFSLHPLRSPAHRVSASTNPLLFVVRALNRVFGQIVELVWMLFVHLPHFDVVLVQNPPAIPTLLVVQMLRIVRGCRLIIDWHNFGYSIMALDKGETSLSVKIAKEFEKTFGRYADGHMCVTSAMKTFLEQKWQIRGKCVVLYDRAPAHFRKLPSREALEFLSLFHIDETTNVFVKRSDTNEAKRLFDLVQSDGNRPALVVSSTSWTPDEDLGILLDALAAYDSRATPSHKQLVIVVTGKGPLQASWKARVRERAWQKVQIATGWLDVADYAYLLGSADLGVCLHTSSSGVDLPMKVVDMFGCGLPVCAFKYNCIGELVIHGENGYLFSTADELCNQFLDLFDTRTGSSQIDHLQHGTEEFQREHWDANWTREVEGVFFS
ncbi:mannosyltransferase [Entophlyctis sp. JEL0112]|nr:mannosyltransferase [Entophlyctis sp. JEL0112]